MRTLFNQGGRPGRILCEHLHGIAHLLNTNGAYDSFQEITHMRRMVALALHLPSTVSRIPTKLPKVIACVDVSNTRMLVLSDNLCLVGALCLTPKNGEVRVRNGVTEMLNAVKGKKNKHVIVCMSAPYQAGVGAMAWEVRTLESIQTTGVPGGFTYDDSGLCFSSLDLHVKPGGNTIETISSLSQPVRDQYTKTLRDDYARVDLTAVTGEPVVASFDTSTSPGGKELVGLLRKLQVERKDLLLQIENATQEREMAVAEARRTFDVENEEMRLSFEKARAQNDEEVEAAWKAAKDGAEVSKKALREANDAIAEARALQWERDELESKCCHLEERVKQLAKEMAKVNSKCEINKSRYTLERSGLIKERDAAVESASQFNKLYKQRSETLCKRVTEGSTQIDTLTAHASRLEVVVKERSDRVLVLEEENTEISVQLECTLAAFNTMSKLLNTTMTKSVRAHINLDVATRRSELLASWLLTWRAVSAPQLPEPKTKQSKMKVACTCTHDYGEEPWVDVASLMTQEAANLRTERDELLKRVQWFEQQSAHVPAPPASPTNFVENEQIVKGVVQMPHDAFVPSIYDFELEADVHAASSALNTMHEAILRLADRGRSGVVAQYNLDSMMPPQGLGNRATPARLATAQRGRKC